MMILSMQNSTCPFRTRSPACTHVSVMYPLIGAVTTGFFLYTANAGYLRSCSIRP